MRKREANAPRMVGADIGGALPRTPDVDADKRHVSCGELGDQRVVVVHTDQDGRVEPLVRIDVERLEQQRVVARLRQPVRNRGEHLSEEDQREVAVPGVVAHDRRNEPRLLRNERARRPVDAVAQGSRRVPHSLSSPHAYVPLVIERA